MGPNNMTVLMIDDHSDNLITLTAVLQNVLPDCTVLTALNGPDGIRMAQVEDPDVILLDIVMPGMDGYEVCRRLKADGYLKDIPVVFLTALRSDVERRVIALEAGADGFLAKPIDKVELTAQVLAMAKIKAANRLQQQLEEHLEKLVDERTRELRQEMEQRKSADEKLLVSMERFRCLFEAAKDGILILDSDTGVILEANWSMTDLLGFPREDICGKHLWDMGIFKDAAESLARFLDLQRHETICYENLSLKTSDGREVDVEFTSSVYVVDHYRVIQCNIRDSSKRKQAETVIKKLRTVFDNAPFGAAISDLNGIFTYVNNSFAATHGYSVRELLGRSARMLHTEQQWPLVDELYQNTIKDGGFRAMEFEHRHKEGNTIPMLMTGSVVYDDHHMPLCYATAAIDLTEYKSKERCLQ